MENPTSTLFFPMQSRHSVQWGGNMNIQKENQWSWTKSSSSEKWLHPIRCNCCSVAGCQIKIDRMVGKLSVYGLLMEIKEHFDMTISHSLLASIQNRNMWVREGGAHRRSQHCLQLRKTEKVF